MNFREYTTEAGVDDLQKSKNYTLYNLKVIANSKASKTIKATANELKSNAMELYDALSNRGLSTSKRLELAKKLRIIDLKIADIAHKIQNPHS